MQRLQERERIYVAQSFMLFSWGKRTSCRGSNVYLPVSLECSFVIAPSVFSNVYLPVSLECSFVIAPSVFSNVYLPVSLECPFLIAPSVFSNVYLPVSLECSFLIASSVFSNVYLPVSLECPFLIVPSVFSNVYLIRFVLLIFSFLGLFTLHYCASLFLIIIGHQFVFLYWFLVKALNQVFVILLIKSYMYVVKWLIYSESRILKIYLSFW